MNTTSLFAHPVGAIGNAFGLAFAILWEILWALILCFTLDLLRN